MKIQKITISVLCLVTAVFVFAKDVTIPWKFGGYEDIDQLYIKYWTVNEDSFDDIQNFVKKNLDSEIFEIWFTKNPPRFRVDRYIKEGVIRCNQFKGKEWEKRDYEGETFILKERIIQVNNKRVTYTLTNISSGAGVELCEYKKYESDSPNPAALKDALSLMTVIPMIASPDDEEMVVSGIEMDKALNPDKYKAFLEDLKKTNEVAGRKTAKWSTSHGFVKIMDQGFAYMDLEWGVSLEGYITEGRSGWGPPVKFDSPVCVYRALTVNTENVDEDIFNF
jgi:hypothetical protein